MKGTNIAGVRALALGSALLVFQSIGAYAGPVTTEASGAAREARVDKSLSPIDMKAARQEPEVHQTAAPSDVEFQVLGVVAQDRSEKVKRALITELLREANIAAQADDADSVQKLSKVEDSVKEAEAVLGEQYLENLLSEQAYSPRRAELTLDMRHALVNWYDGLEDVRGTLSAARTAVFQPASELELPINTRANSSGAKQRGSSSEVLNRILLFVSGAAEIAEEYYWIILLLIVPALLVPRLIRR